MYGVHVAFVQLTTDVLQQSPAVLQLPPAPTQESVLTSTHLPFSQNPEQHWKPLVH